MSDNKKKEILAKIQTKEKERFNKFNELLVKKETPDLETRQIEFLDKVWKEIDERRSNIQNVDRDIANSIQNMMAAMYRKTDKKIKNLLPPTRA